MCLLIRLHALFWSFVEIFLRIYKIICLWWLDINPTAICTWKNKHEPLFLAANRLYWRPFWQRYDRNILRKSHYSVWDFHNSKVLTQALPWATVKRKIRPSNSSQLASLPSFRPEFVRTGRICSFYTSWRIGKKRPFLPFLLISVYLLSCRHRWVVSLFVWPRDCSMGQVGRVVNLKIARTPD